MSVLQDGAFLSDLVIVEKNKKIPHPADGARAARYT